MKRDSKEFQLSESLLLIRYQKSLGMYSIALIGQPHG